MPIYNFKSSASYGFAVNLTDFCSRIESALPKSLKGEAAPNPYKEPFSKNPADAYQELQGPLHDFGSYLTACLPKFIQQFSVYKDELTST